MADGSTLLSTLSSEPLVSSNQLSATETSVNSLQSSQSEVFNVIIPPPDVRSIIEKTAQFVAKNGLEFEKRVLLYKGGERKFSFLLPGNPYKPYYDAKVKEYSTGEVNEATQPQIPEAILKIKQREAEKQKKKEQTFALTSYATNLDVLTHVENTAEGLLKLTDFSSSLTLGGSKLLAIDSGRPPEPPREDLYTFARPFAAALDIDIIKLTAQYVARNGQRFLSGLTQRERGNAQFAFLRTTHPLFSHFTSLVEAYSRCLAPDSMTLAFLEGNISADGRLPSNAGEQRFIKATDLLNGPQDIPTEQTEALMGILKRVISRQRWEEDEEKRKQEKSKEEAEEREQVQTLDWHEFVVVEVIQFTEDDDTLDLGPPIELSQLKQPKMIPPLAPPEAEPKSEFHEEASVMPDQLNATVLPSMYTPSPAMGTVQPIMIQPAPMAPLPTMLSVQHQQSGFSDVPPEPQVQPTTSIVIVSDYVRQPKKRTRQTDDMVKCPITDQWIAADKFTEHLRILLLDPKWKEEKDALLAKARKGSAFAPDEDFETNLAKFVMKRPDLFGSVEDECESAYVPTTKRK